MYLFLFLQFNLFLFFSRDSNGRVLFSYAANIGSGSVVIAELWAILLRNKISWRLEPRVQAFLC
ncbi:hypothetical protein GLYMA_03G193900v4 [Glycine max]|nr:hypothetical protein GLYMA_03G193900v4 [Glycine max]KAH1070840.1 hypothetical protein GYH30_007734 [Glycine max]